MKLCFSTSTLGCFERYLGKIVSLAKEYNVPAIEIRGIDGVLDNTAIEALSNVGRKKFRSYLGY